MQEEDFGAAAPPPAGEATPCTLPVGVSALRLFLLESQLAVVRGHFDPVTWLELTH